MLVVVLVVVYGGRESDWGEDVRSWKNLWRREGEIFGMVEGGTLEGGFGDGELVRRFLIWGFGGDCCGIYGLMVLVELFSFFFFFRHVKRRVDVTAEANWKKKKKKARRPTSQLREHLRICNE